MLVLLQDVSGREIGAKNAWPDAAPFRAGERLEHMGGWYEVRRVYWPDEGGFTQRLWVDPVPVKGSVTVEAGFSERTDMPVDKGPGGGA